MIRLTVNGRSHELDVAADTPLLDVLRGRLALMSPKLGCGLEQCGSCKVLADGEAVYSCTAPASGFEGREIETVEGFAKEGRWHPVQRAMLEHNASQCGYCLSGILVAAKALFDRSPRPSEAELRVALDDHLCRCGAQPRILRALREVASGTSDDATEGKSGHG